MSIKTLEAEIMTVLQSVPGVAVYDHEPKSFPFLPAITLNYNQFFQSRNRFKKREITYSWELRLYVGLGSDAATAADTTKDLVNQYINAFRAAPDLNGIAQRAEITAGSLEVVTDVQNPYYLHLFSLEVIEEEA
ncbi:hypothetical protein ACFO25_09915 [Paenactinomyces guangxiensis]|uniref:Uncharacterized protein n=1 Tax=Paenactinomyces guangxiensis TaxID=1490290 RepID=A0A7W1WS65_9BACL|nr:hypothetical protein [Paenactinomyces guangxiensis]MBA4495100.1 hypothetical protein [Paenactinomyces guangxiensis]MBH8592216.1 hypothetical protein [Paenactinomyces guangxiensis]